MIEFLRAKTAGTNRAGAAFAAIVGVSVIACAGCGATGAEQRDTLTIAAYSVVREALHEGILPAFTAEWRNRTGRRLRFEESYNASGAQSRAVASGFDADVVILSHEGDMDYLAKNGAVRKDWRSRPHGGNVSLSRVVIGVRPGNPLGIRDWPDLARPGVQVLYPDPKTSGGAKWNINAIYGAGLLPDGVKGRRDPDRALRWLAAIQDNVVNMDGSGRQSLATFERGTGNAIITYENELKLRRRWKDSNCEAVVPRSTLLIESPAAIVERVADRHQTRELASAFLDFLVSDKGQAILEDFGFEPLDSRERMQGSASSPVDTVLFNIKDLGGWSQVNERLYGSDGLWTGLFTRKQARSFSQDGTGGRR